MQDGEAFPSNWDSTRPDTSSLEPEYGCHTTIRPYRHQRLEGAMQVKSNVFLTTPTDPVTCTTLDLCNANVITAAPYQSPCDGSFVKESKALFAPNTFFQPPERVLHL